MRVYEKNFLESLCEVLEMPKEDVFCVECDGEVSFLYYAPDNKHGILLDVAIICKIECDCIVLKAVQDGKIIVDFDRDLAASWSCVTK